MRILGLDEAGRGPAIGEMVIAGVLFDAKDSGKLKEMGIKDSKKLKHPVRVKLAKQIREIALDHAVVAVPPKVIDEALVRSELNHLETKHFKDMINALKPDKVIVDSPEANLKKFRRKLEDGLRHRDVEMVVENFADENYPEVGAASILAKVKREEIVKKLAEKHGDFGSGYCHDPLTMKFLKKCWKENKSFPDCVRKNWVTVKGIPSKIEQKKLREFFR